MHIRPTRLLENGAFNIEFDADNRLCLGSIGFDWDDSAKIKKAIAANKDNKDKEKNLWERNRQLKRQKQCQKQSAKAKSCLKTCHQADHDNNDN